MAIAYSMKSIASSIQPNLAAARTRHCSGVIVRYHGTDPAVAVADIKGGVTGTLLRVPACRSYPSEGTYAAFETRPRMVLTRRNASTGFATCASKPEASARA